MLPVKTNPDKPRKSALERARERLTAIQEQQRRVTRIGFVIDATASRESTWEQAQTVQAKMFRAAGTLGNLALRLVHFRSSHLKDHGWLDDPRAVAAQMAGVECLTGITQILPALRAFLADAPEQRASAVILVGDSFEEDSGQARDLAVALKAAGIRVFSFLEGDDWTAESVFRALADATGGKFARLGAELPLADLCAGVTLLASGGTKALERLPAGKAKQLLLGGPSR